MRKITCTYVWLIVLLFLVISQVSGLNITGKVFYDQDNNRMQSAAEPGLQNVAVSDGRSVVLTDSTGTYRLETEEGRIVFVSLPRGFRASESFYATATANRNLDFPLIEWEDSKKGLVRFVQVTDLHITNEITVDTFSQDIDEINAMHPAPTFVIATGDLVNIGKNLNEYDNYVKAIKRFKAPFFSVIGNHDLCPGEDRLANYRKYLGPEHYSFNVGNCHFVAMNCMNFDQAQMDWILKDLATAPKGYRRIFAQHYLPTREQLQFLARCGAAAVVSGHWHGNRVWESYGILDFNTPPLRFGGIDRNARGFRVVEVNGAKTASELRLGGFHRQATVVSPAGPSLASNGRLTVVVNAYDTSARVVKVECQTAGQRVSLKRVGAWSWLGELKVTPEMTGTRQLTAWITDSKGESWTAQSKFEIESGSPVVKTGTAWPQFHGDHAHLGHSRDTVNPPLRLAWIGSTEGFIGLSSPMVSDGSVVIGVNDFGDLKDCGVVAFDAKTGAVRWRFHADSAIKNSLALSNGRAFAVSVAGYLYCLDAVTGKQLWKAGLKRNRERWDVTAPAVANGVVYAGGWACLAAFDIKSGKQLWEKEWKTTDWWPSSYVVPAVKGECIYLTNRNVAHALSCKTGDTLWQVKGLYRGCSAVDDCLYTIKDTFLTAMKCENGDIIWKGTEKLGESASAPAISGDKIVVGDMDGRVLAFSRTDGKLLWSFQTGESLTNLQPYQRGGSDTNSSPAVSGSTVYVGASDGYLYALSLDTGKKLWSCNLGVPIASSPAVSGNAIFAAAYDGNVYAFVGIK